MAAFKLLPLSILVVVTTGLPKHLWNQEQNGIFHMSQNSHTQASTPQCNVGPDSNRFDCHPDPGSNSDNCQQRGCCWDKSTNLGRYIDIPYCFFPDNYQPYAVKGAKNTDQGVELMIQKQDKSHWPNDVMLLKIEVHEHCENILHFKMTDATKDRFEVPIDIAKDPATKPASTNYEFKYSNNPFSIQVTRKSTGAVVFDTNVPEAPLIYTDQFIQLTTKLGGDGSVYGLGEHKDSLQHTSDKWKLRSYWNRDQGPSFDTNLYGTHPFYMALEDDSQAHGVFLLNSNAMDIEMHPYPSLTYRTIGGILDFYVFMGPTPDRVIQQYTDIIGKPFMPPYWSLGFHLCRYGYGSSEELKKTIQRNRAIGIPYEVQWNDIDYMDKYYDWTYDKNKYSGLPDIVKDLHENGQKYIIIVDPGISNKSPGSYPPWDEGIKQDIFIKNSTGQPMIGVVWPGSCGFPDFAHPNAASWWQTQVQRYHDAVPFDGLWTDMNEPSNFVMGSMEGCPDNKYNNPPYTPGIADNSLGSHTLCPSASQYYSNHYNMHNMYGHFEVKATSSSLDNVLKKRSIVISRSSFPSTGHFGGHWSGDISSTWEDLHYSIPELLEFQMYGIPLMGADICGFHLNTTEELCTRWMQLGAFYPFSRNHNDLSYIPQDPAAFSKAAQSAMILALEYRYMLLPYLYTLFRQSHMSGAPVARPLVFQYPSDKNTRSIDTQFFWGSGLMISPVLTQGATTVNAYIPKDRFYAFPEGDIVEGKGSYDTLDAPLNKINLHVRGGTVIPMLRGGATTTTQQRKKYFILLAALDKNSAASGDLYWDDGETLDVIQKKLYTCIKFEAKSGTLTSSLPMKPGFTPPDELSLGEIMVFGVMSKPTSVTVNNATMDFDYHSDKKALHINISIQPVSLFKPLHVTW